MGGVRAGSLAERLAMELRWMEHCEAAASCGNTTTALTKREVWGRISECLKDSYRADARHLLKFLSGKIDESSE